MQSTLARRVSLLAMILALSTTAGAADSSWTIFGQMRPRFELRSGYRFLPPASSEPVVFISQRTRLGVVCQVEPRARLTVALQDVRTWGDEISTDDASAANLDVHLAHVELIPSKALAVQIGRQEFSYDDERILGSDDWRQSGRVHDAVRVKLHLAQTDLHLTVSHHEQGEPTASASYFNVHNYEDMAFLWGSTHRGMMRASALALYDSYDRTFQALIQDRWTLGGRFELGGQSLIGSAEGYYQFGRHKVFSSYTERIQRDLGAYRLAFDLTHKSERQTITFEYDYSSGDRDPTDLDYGVFEAPYGSSHEAFGWADLFINMAEDTQDHGLQDAALKTQLRHLGSLTIDLHAHYFALAQADAAGRRRLGFETDLMASGMIMNKVRLLAGYSLVLPTEALKQLQGSKDNGHWFWTMLDVNVN